MIRERGSGEKGLVALGIFMFALAGSAPAALAQDLVVTSRAECLAPGWEELSCGGVGTFFVGRSESCGPDTINSAEGGVYPRPAATETKTASDRSAWIPCAEGRCFSDARRGPWVAVVDWDDDHGHSVGEMILQASGYTVGARLFALETPGLRNLGSLPTVGDAHVLAQLCHVARQAQDDPPLAVNMSFGRLDSKPCGPMRTQGLSCRIDAVIRHLVRDLQIPIFGAAGHEGQLLFPAAHPEVHAIGSLDLEHFRVTGEARPLPQTPAGISGLFAGHGLYLEEPRGTGVWSVPPGSSYASALAAGWWAGYRASFPPSAGKLLGLDKLPRFCGSWGPGYGRDPDGRDLDGRIELFCGSTPLPGSALPGPSALLATALGQRPEVCGGALPHDGLLLEVDGVVEDPVRRTLADVQSNLIRPAPQSRPCVPCHGSAATQEGDPIGDGLAVGSSSGLKAVPVEVTVDLSESGALAHGLELVGIYLDAAGRTFRFSDSRNATLLGELALGRVERLRLGNVPRSGVEALALVFEMRLREGGEVFRSSTPVHLHEHREEP